MKNPDIGANNNHTTVPQTLYLGGAKTQKRLLKASKLMRYYKLVGCHVILSNTVYKTSIKTFTDQWAGLKDWKQQLQLVVPKITGKIGVRTIPLSCATRTTALTTRPASDHKDDLPH
eukprot:5287329-Ditylum_brightwellii.AAC.1